MKTYTARFLSLVLLVIAATAACDSSPLTAPVASTISISALDTSVVPGGSTEVTAVVIEEAGTAVHDGTQVRFTATLGRVEPETVETRDGVARATFTAGTTTGTAKVSASSGAATASDLGNVVEITVG